MTAATDPPKLTLAELQRRRAACLHRSRAALCARPQVYRRIKRQLQRVVYGPVDIGDYGALARDLARALEQMGPGTIFHGFYYDQLDPRRGGRATCFRPFCADLLDQLKRIEQRQPVRRRLRVVPGGRSGPAAK